MRQLTKQYAVLTAIFFFFTFTTELFAQEKPDHHENHYHLSLFSGYTLDYKGNNGYKLGIEYEYRFSDLFGLGGSFDYTGADFEIFAFSLGATFYPFPFPLILALGGGAKNAGNTWKPFTRGVVIYDFHLENISLGPMVMYDRFAERKDIMSYGLSVGIGF